jgi:uncharacterized membrane protein
MDASPSWSGFFVSPIIASIRLDMIDKHVHVNLAYAALGALVGTLLAAIIVLAYIYILWCRSRFAKRSIDFGPVNLSRMRLRSGSK